MPLITCRLHFNIYVDDVVQDWKSQLQIVLALTTDCIIDTVFFEDERYLNNQVRRQPASSSTKTIWPQKLQTEQSSNVVYDMCFREFDQKVSLMANK